MGEDKRGMGMVSTYFACVMCARAHKKLDLFTHGGRKSRSSKEGKRCASLSGLGPFCSRGIEIHELSFRQDGGEVIGGNKCSLSF